MCLGFALALQILFTALRTFLKNEATDESEKAERRTREKPAGRPEGTKQAGRHQMCPDRKVGDGVPGTEQSW